AIDRIERTWIVTPHLHDVLDFHPSEAIVHRTGVMRLFAGRAHRDARLNVPDLVVERARLLPLLARRAQQAGVEVVMGATAAGIELAAVAVSIMARRAEGQSPLVLHARNLIGADGVKSTVALRFQTRAQHAVP